MVPVKGWEELSNNWCFWHCFFPLSVVAQLNGSTQTARDKVDSEVLAFSSLPVHYHIKMPLCLIPYHLDQALKSGA